MRIRSILCLAFLGACSSAYADVIISGSVSTAGSQGTTCSRSATGVVNLTCNDSVSTATANASGDAFSGAGIIDAFAPAPFSLLASANAEINLQLDESYVLTGGTGTTGITFDVHASEPSMGNPPTVMCSFIFNGSAQSCLFGPSGFTETVEYNVPFSIELLVSMNGHSSDGEPADAQFNYDLSQPGLATTPEPASVLLLMPGLVGIGFAARSRAKGWLGGGGSIPHSSR